MVEQAAHQLDLFMFSSINADQLSIASKWLKGPKYDWGTYIM